MNGHGRTRTKAYMTEPKNIIKKNGSMAFYNTKEQGYLETDALGASLGAHHLQVRDGMQFPINEAPGNAVLQPRAFMSKSLTSAETHYSNIQRSPRHTPWPRKNLYYCFACEVSVMMDHKQLVAIFKKDVASLSHRLQRIFLFINQHSIRIQYKPGP